VIRTHTVACDELFDSVGQTIFGIGLQLEDCLESSDDPVVRAKLDASIRGLHDIIGRIRERGDIHSAEVAQHD
jgi:hypothetical protein